jgi:hypothetical protein
MVGCYFNDVFPDQETDDNLYDMWKICYDRLTEEDYDGFIDYDGLTDLYG